MKYLKLLILPAAIFYVQKANAVEKANLKIEDHVKIEQILGISSEGVNIIPNEEGLTEFPTTETIYSKTREKDYNKYPSIDSITKEDVITFGQQNFEGIQTLPSTFRDGDKLIILPKIKFVKGSKEAVSYNGCLTIRRFESGKEVVSVELYDEDKNGDFESINLRFDSQNSLFDLDSKITNYENIELLNKYAKNLLSKLDKAYIDIFNGR